MHHIHRSPDNLTLWDKLAASCPREPEGERIKMQKLANALILTSQRIAFLHASQDFARTKHGDSNSYQSPDSVNRLDWARRCAMRDLRLHKGLIALRRAHPAFRLQSAAEIQAKLTFLKMPSTRWWGISWAPMREAIRGD